MRQSLIAGKSWATTKFLVYMSAKRKVHFGAAHSYSATGQNACTSKFLFLVRAAADTQFGSRAAASGIYLPFARRMRENSTHHTHTFGAAAETVRAMTVWQAERCLGKAAAKLLSRVTGIMHRAWKSALYMEWRCLFLCVSAGERAPRNQ